MLRSDFSRKAHAYFLNYYFCRQYVFSSTLASNRRQFHVKLISILNQILGAQWLSGRVPRGREIEPHRRHCVVVLEQDTFILAY